jgi:N-methylhydantoinase A
LADTLGIRRVYVPRDPGLLSAWGVLAADAVRDRVETVRLLDPSQAALARRLRPLEHEAARALVRDGITRPRLERTLDVRYAGQSYELQVPYGRTWRVAFHERHQRLFGHADPRRAVEVVAVRVRASGGATAPPRQSVARSAGGVKMRRSTSWFGDGSSQVGVVRRDALGRGYVARGPLIVCEYSATTVLPPGWRMAVDATGGLLLEQGRHV